MTTTPHIISVVCEGQKVDGFTSYHLESSLITPTDPFELHCPWSKEKDALFRRDAEVFIQIDGVTMIRGFIDKRTKRTRQNILEISGRDRAGRLVDESAPAIDYSGLRIDAAIDKLMDPWFDDLTLSDARNRILRRGKGKRVASGSEPVVTINIRTPRHGVVHPGQSRWQIIKEIASRSDLMAWSSADGRELFLGKPNHNQAPQYLFLHPGPGSSSKSTVTDMVITEDDGERYSLIMVAGTGGQSDTNYGKNVSNRTGVVFDNPLNKVDGTGRDFLRPKRLFMPERDFATFGDAQRVAENEQARRDYRRHIVYVDTPGHGQFLSGTATLFAPNTVARVVDEEFSPPLDGLYLVVSVTFSCTRDQGQYSHLTMVPVGTKIIL